MMLTPEHWHQRASHARTVAAFMHDPEGRRLMLVVASLYDKLALRAMVAAHAVPSDRRDYVLESRGRSGL